MIRDDATMPLEAGELSMTQKKFAPVDNLCTRYQI